ncbi:drug resistance efflux protein [Loigolactobacillus bifermentans DSM 20003]|uniref:Drug resistance efflux protein n=1 Tax=Loigolactobacillus bifermentans DSM 20003 TaxID=1423726 RepID=A0A0R1GH28_9LACO|nr:drug resistance efflux protein [Loigolactobacillus bifermentans DSM 20003]QGG60831.1 MFS transporter [Loigolactobacillus bifermentans]
MKQTQVSRRFQVGVAAYLNERTIFLQQKLPRNVSFSILATGLLSFMGIMVETSLNVAFVTLTKTFHVNLATIQWLTTGNLLVVTMIMLTSAHLIKRYPVKNLFIFATVAFTVGCLLDGFAQNFPVMLLGRLIQALGTGLSTPLIFHIILSCVPRNRVATYNGLAAMLIALAPTLGPTYGGLLTSLLSWRWVFFILLPFMVIVILLGVFNLDLPPLKPDDQFDVPGFVILAIALTIFDLSFTAAAKAGFSSWQFGGLLALTAVLVGLYILYNRHAKRHLMDFSIFKDPLIVWHWVSYFILQFINIGCAFILPQVVQYALHRSAFTAGLLVLPGCLVGAIVAPLAGRWFDNCHRPAPLVVGHLVLLAGALIFALIGEHTTIWTIAIFYILMRAGFGLAFGNTISDASRYVDPYQKADLNASYNTSQQYAGSVGTGVFAAVIGVFQAGHTNLTTSTLQGAIADFWIIVVLATIALLGGWYSYRHSHFI